MVVGPLGKREVQNLVRQVPCGRVPGSPFCSPTFMYGQEGDVTVFGVRYEIEVPTGCVAPKPSPAQVISSLNLSAALK